MTTPSPADIISLLARGSGEAYLLLATVRHATFETLYLVKDPTAIVSRGNTFSPTFFDIAMVNDDGKPARASFRFPNVDPIIGQKLGAVIDPVEVTLEVISVARPNVPISQAPRLQLMNVAIAPDFISGDLLGRDWSSEPLGTIVVTPTRFPALFRRRS